MYTGTLIHTNTIHNYTFMDMKYLPIKVILVVRLWFSQWCC